MATPSFTTASPSRTPTRPPRRLAKSSRSALPVREGEARNVAVRHTWNPAGPDYADPAEHDDDETFDIGELGPVADGDWPTMVTSRALTLLPEDIQARFGRNVDTVLNGGYLEIPLAAETELVATLREHGFDVTRDDDLINALDGRTFSPLAD